MAYEIVPKSGMYVSAAEVARRIASKFSHVIADEAAGQEAALRTAAWIESASPAAFLGRHQEALSYAKRLRSLKPGEALVIRFGDEPNSLLSVTVLPDERLKFGHSGLEKEEALRGFVERCAKALDADVVVI